MNFSNLVHWPNNLRSSLNPEKKIHLRLEDTVLITPEGAENMTASAPARVEEIYALIRQKALGASATK